MVTLLEIYDPNPELSFYETEFFYEAVVYCLGTGSWRKVSICVPRNFVPYNYSRTYTKGVFSWWAIFGDTLEGILSFDI